MRQRITTVQELIKSPIVIYHSCRYGKPSSEEYEVGDLHFDHGEPVVDLIPLTEGARGQRFTVNLLVCGIVTDPDTGLDLSVNPLCWLETNA